METTEAYSWLTSATEALGLDGLSRAPYLKPKPQRPRVATYWRAVVVLGLLVSSALLYLVLKCAFRLSELSSRSRRRLAEGPRDEESRERARQIPRKEEYCGRATEAGPDRSSREWTFWIDAESATWFPSIGSMSRSIFRGSFGSISGAQSFEGPAPATSSKAGEAAAAAASTPSGFPSSSRRPETSGSDVLSKQVGTPDATNGTGAKLSQQQAGTTSAAALLRAAAGEGGTRPDATPGNAPNIEGHDSLPPGSSAARQGTSEGTGSLETEKDVDAAASNASSRFAALQLSDQGFPFSGDADAQEFITGYEYGDEWADMYLYFGEYNRPDDLDSDNVSGVYNNDRLFRASFHSEEQDDTETGYHHYMDVEENDQEVAFLASLESAETLTQLVRAADRSTFSADMGDGRSVRANFANVSIMMIGVPESPHYRDLEEHYPFPRIGKGAGNQALRDMLKDLGRLASSLCSAHPDRVSNRLHAPCVLPNGTISATLHIVVEELEMKTSSMWTRLRTVLAPKKGFDGRHAQRFRRDVQMLVEDLIVTLFGQIQDFGAPKGEANRFCFELKRPTASRCKGKVAVTVYATDD